MSDAPTNLRALLDRERVVARVTELFLATDRKDWAAVERCFTTDVRFDMSSVGAGPASTVRAADIAAGWRTGLDPIEHVHHQAGNFVVTIEGDRAHAFCYGVAWHHRTRQDGRNVRTFVGSYDYELARHGADGDWRIAAMRFDLKFIDGNAALESPE